MRSSSDPDLPNSNPGSPDAEVAGLMQGWFAFTASGVLIGSYEAKDFANMVMDRLVHCIGER